MGIRPNGSGAIPPVTPDNPESRYSDWLTDLEDSGEIVGGVWQETDAKASSGNSGVTDLAGRVAALEAAYLSPTTTSGNRWDATKQGTFTTLRLNGISATQAAVLPAGYRPTARSYIPLYDAGGSIAARGRIDPDGTINIWGNTGDCYTTVTYITS